MKHVGSSEFQPSKRMSNLWEIVYRTARQNTIPTSQISSVVRLLLRLWNTEHSSTTINSALLAHPASDWETPAPALPPASCPWSGRSPQSEWHLFCLFQRSVAPTSWYLPPRQTTDKSDVDKGKDKVVLHYATKLRTGTEFLMSHYIDTCKNLANTHVEVPARKIGWFP